MSTALICGVSGQDGAYLAQLLLGKGYSVIGTSRDAATSTFGNLARLGIREQLQTISMDATDFKNVLAALIHYAPDETYNLSGQSSVGLSFDQPVETIESIVTGTLNFLEAIRIIRKPMRFYNAGSGECFGDTRETPASESSPFQPRSPYAAAKVAAQVLVANYREAYGIFASTGILFNHESPLRSERFVTKKIVAAAARIASGSDEKLCLGNLNVQRDWGWAPEYVEAMWLMLRQEVPDDFVIATGRTTSLEYFVQRVFERFGLDWRHHVQTDSSHYRPLEIEISRADPSKANRVLGWKSKWTIDEVIVGLCDAAQ